MVPAETALREYEDGCPTTLLEYNLLLDGCRISELNEKFIETKIDKLDEIGGCGIIYQLTLARLTELTLICAGNYADNLEFSAAGDLLVNPRLIHVHIEGIQEPVQKNRHASLTLQLKPEADTPAEAIQWLSKKTHLEIIKQPLLPYLYDRLNNFGTISSDYLHSVCRRMEKIAEVIGFLSAGRLPEACMSNNLRQIPSKTEWGFISANLCRFTNEIFFVLGNDIFRLIENDRNKSRINGKLKTKPALPPSS